MDKNASIYVAGHRGLVGSAVVRRLQAEGYQNLILKGRQELDLVNQSAVSEFFHRERPQYVILAAAKVGGIGANSTYPADFLYQNLAIAQNVIQAAYETGVTKLLNLGSSCIYPKMAPQPIREESLLTGPLEPTNEAYAIAKIAAIKLCWYYNRQYGTNYLSAMPTNIYGPGDSYDLANSHVLPALIRKFHEAKVNGGPVVLWGDGSPYREFLYSEDLASALVFLLQEKNAVDVGELINVGSGNEVTIRELAGLVARIIGYEGPVTWDPSKPNGTPRKLMDSTRLFSMGWRPRVDLEEGIRLAYRDFIENRRR